jgi:hypothetical protein
MAYDLGQTCETHASRFDCPDALINLSGGRYGLIVHDGGSSVMNISFCPWCGKSLGDVRAEDGTEFDIV